MANMTKEELIIAAIVFVGTLITFQVGVWFGRWDTNKTVKAKLERKWQSEHRGFYGQN